MAENTINDFNTLPEQVQINKEDIEANTADIAKLKDDIGKIKPNAWEERKFILNIGEEGNTDFTTYNPITDTNTPVNIQKSFTDKDTYSIMEAVNSYSFFTSGSLNGASTSIYAICTDPSNSLYDMLGLDEQNESNVSIVLIAAKDNTGSTSSQLYINCTNIKTNGIKFNSMTIKDNDANVKNINKITDNDDDSLNTLLTAYAINEYYLKKSDASNTYLNKTDASNTYITKSHADTTYLSKQDYEESIDKGDIQFTTQGWTKFKAITDTEGQTITLSVPGDLLEHVQVTGTNDLKLQLFYNGHVVFENIYLHPNNSINNLDYITGAKSTYFTGQAVLTLSTQSDALFYIVYQESTGITLHLITTI